MYSCLYCNKEFKYESEKGRHEQSHIPQFECIECKKKFSFLSALRRHQKQHQRTGSVKCPQCGRNFRDETLLKRHIQYAHKDTYICAKCYAKFNSQQALLSHSKTHKPKLERRYRCGHNGCEKTFNFAHHLRHHELTHTDNKPYYCKECGKGYIQLNHYKTHLLAHQPSALECSHCMKKFSNKYALKRHHKLHKNKCKMEVSSQELYLDNNLKSQPSLSHVRMEENKLDILVEQNIIKENNNIQNNTDSIKISKEDNNNDLRNKERPEDSKCHTCKCKSGKFIENSMPQLEYKDDGTIKIKEFVDVDIDIDVVTVPQKSGEELQSIFPYNSCRDVLGKCIVSGNGTISEECICAKMALDDELMISQEVDEITPCPTTAFT
ncbi:unnamed protein product [Leptidea sinapis]|uniref:C2H2-type domain-containing protein n=1 Tax=Leptidea sinapis TaxID=189913 RepID=A0A5E4PZB9_9NEOP|nr:unnamed protein product [Leptidea sinapis]